VEHLDDVRARRRGYIEDFLRERAIRYERLGEIVERRTGPARHVLLTSSPVQGLANATSDIDLIRIQEDPLPGAKMATQIFEDGHHLEVVSFGAAEVARALADLRALAGHDPAGLVAVLDGWDREHEVRTKYLERIVNGVAQDWSLPYGGWHGDLGVVWMWGSLHKALKQALFLRWAEAAGESRGRLGYAVNVVLYLMDAILSSRGDVYSNKKWYLLRWNRWSVTDPGRRDGVVRRLDEACAALTAAAKSPQTAQPLTRLLTGITRDVLTALTGVGHLSLQVSLSKERCRLAFLPGAELMIQDSVAMPVAAGTDFEFLTRVDDDPAMTRGRASELLNAARAGALRIGLRGDA
jgi:hypothetical protein